MNILILDGGGVKTRAWIADEKTGAVLAEARAGASNFGRVREAGLRQVLEQLNSELSHVEFHAVIAGLAGVGREPERLAAHSVIQSQFPAKKVHVTTDAQLAYHGAFASNRSGILLITGTGTIAFYRNPAGHEFFRAGGWGPVLGDEGGGAWIGREVLRHCLLEWEQDTLSPLHAAALEQLNIENAPQILTKVYSENFGPADWAELAPLAFHHAKEDTHANSILKLAAVEWIALVERLVEDQPQHDSAIPLVILGGLWNQREYMQPLLQREIELRNLPLVISEPDGGPLEGGLAIFRSLPK